MYDIQDMSNISHMHKNDRQKKMVLLCKHLVQFRNRNSGESCAIWSCNLISASCLLKWKVHLSRSLSRMRSEDKTWLKIFGKEQLIVTGKTNHCQYWVYQRCVSLSLQLQKLCHIAAVHPCKAPPAIMASV